MKKLNKFVYIIIFCLTIASFFTLFGGSVYADVPTAEEYYGLDYNTYEALLTLKKNVTGDYLTSTFPKNFFDSSNETGYKSYTPPTTDGEKIQADLANGILNLVVGDESGYACLKSLKPLTSLACLNNLSFGGIVELKLDNNNFTSIESTQLASFTDLKSLSINNSGLQSVNLSQTTQSRLESLSLQGNNLTALDMPYLKSGASVNLFDNYIEKLSDLNFLSLLNSLDISFNNILNETEKSVAEFTTAIGCTPILLVQGLKQDLQAMSQLTTYNNNSIVQGLTTIVSYRETAGDKSDYVGEIVRSDNTQVVSSLYMPIGKLRTRFAYTDGNNLESYHIEKLTEYKNNILPNNPIVVCKIEGEETTNYVTEKDLSFESSFNFDKNLPNYKNVIENATIGLSGGASISEAGTSLITNAGKYSLNFYVEFDGLQSSGVRINAEKTGKNYIPLVILLIVVILSLLVCGVFLKRWFANGAVVAPLTDKEIHQINKRAERRGNPTRLKYSYEKDKDVDESGVYRKNKNNLAGQDYVDLDESDDVNGETQNVDGDYTGDDFGSFDENSYEDGYENNENGDDFYGEN